MNQGPEALETYGDLDETEDDGLPQDIAVLARAELDPPFVEELDIYRPIGGWALK